MLQPPSSHEENLVPVDDVLGDFAQAEANPEVGLTKTTALRAAGVGLGLMAVGSVAFVLGFGWAFTRFGDDASNPVASLAMACLLYTSPSPRDRTRSRMPCALAAVSTVLVVVAALWLARRRST